MSDLVYIPGLGMRTPEEATILLRRCYQEMARRHKERAAFEAEVLELIAKIESEEEKSPQKGRVCQHRGKAAEKRPAIEP